MISTLSTGLSTLSTGLSKSDEFIKNNAVNTYTRLIQFDNDKKVHLTEDTAIPGSDIPVPRYVRCSALMFPNDKDMSQRPSIFD